MRLVDASRYFDSTVVRDAYTNVALFNAQTSSFIESQVDGTISRRRIISVSNEVTMPARRVVKYANEIWITGDGIKDTFQNVVVRVSYTSMRATELYSLLTPAEMALGSTGTTAWAQTEYLKSTVNGPVESEYDAQYDITFSSYETVTKGNFLKYDTRIFHIRGTHTVLEGFEVAESDEIDASTVSVTFTETGAYNPVTDSYAGNSVVTTGLIVDRYKLFELYTAADTLNHAGDVSLVVAKSAVTPTVGMSVSASGSWRVEGLVSYSDAWLCHLRRA